MPPKYLSIFESLACDNVLSIVKDDFKTTLDVLYPSPALPDFVQRTLGEFGTLEFPAFSVKPFRNTGTDQGQYTDRQVRLLMSVAVTDADLINVTRRLMQYVRTLVVVLESIDDSRLRTGAPTNRILTSQITKIDREYKAVGKRTNPSTLYMQPCDFDLTIDYNER